MVASAQGRMMQSVMPDLVMQGFQVPSAFGETLLVIEIGPARISREARQDPPVKSTPCTPNQAVISCQTLSLSLVDIYRLKACTSAPSTWP
jgi:hypothetical protein